MNRKPIKSPLKAIRTHCLECSAGSAEKVASCEGPLLIGDKGICALHPYRFGKGSRAGVETKLTPLKAIAKNCRWCGGGSNKERQLCPSTECWLYSFREGKNPFISKKAQLARLRNVTKAREKALERGLV